MVLLICLFKIVSISNNLIKIRLFCIFLKVILRLMLIKNVGIKMVYLIGLILVISCVLKCVFEIVNFVIYVFKILFIFNLMVKNEKLK